MTSFKRQRKLGAGVKPGELDYTLRISSPQTPAKGKQWMSPYMSSMSWITRLETGKTVQRSHSNPCNHTHQTTHLLSVNKTKHRAYSNPCNLLHTHAHEEKGVSI